MEKPDERDQSNDNGGGHWRGQRKKKVGKGEGGFERAIGTRKQIKMKMSEVEQKGLAITESEVWAMGRKGVE